MANIVRGFRRVGWVVTVPVAAIIILISFESTGDYAASLYETKLWSDPLMEPKGFIPDLEQPGKRMIEMKGLGYAYFPEEVPSDLAARVIDDFRNTRVSAAQEKSKRKEGLISEEAPLTGFRPIPVEGSALPEPSWNFTVQKKVNKLKLTELVAGSLLLPAVIIQGIISVFAWVIRGFASS